MTTPPATTQEPPPSSITAPGRRHIRRFSAFHYFARWFYRTVFIFLGGNILASILQAVATSENGGLPTANSIKKSYLIELAIRYPIVFSVGAIVIIGLGVSGFVIDNILNAEERQAAESADKAQILVVQEAVKVTINEALRGYDAAHGASGDREPNAYPSVPLAHEADWGEAPELRDFYGRDHELDELRQWILDDHAQLVAVLGIGGVGKTAIAATVARRLKGQFDHIFWRSLHNAPPLRGVLEQCVQLVSGHARVDMPDEVEEQLAIVMQYLRAKRCLLVFDNYETILQGGNRPGQYRNGYEGYGRLLERLGEETHQSCLLVTSREKPREVAQLESASGQADAQPVRSLIVRSLPLPGLSDGESQEILRGRGLTGSPEAWATLIHLYSGNPLYLKIVAEPIEEIFGGDIGAFLKEGETVFGDLRDPLEFQFSRLSPFEQSVMYWLAIEREPTTLEQLRAAIVPFSMKGKDGGPSTPAVEDCKFTPNWLRPVLSISKI